MAAPKGHPKWGGRPKGQTNKVTADARAAIAQFVDGNAHRLQQWLDTIANGQRGPDTEDQDGNKVPGELIIAPNPTKAFELFQSVIEYHVPKLARTELTGKDGGPMTLEHIIGASRRPVEPSNS
jgi:hypothetical protein